MSSAIRGRANVLPVDMKETATPLVAPQVGETRSALQRVAEQFSLLDVATRIVRPLRSDEALVASVFVFGLWLDRQWPLAGQLAASAFAWAVFLGLVNRTEGEQRLRLWFCLVWATVGEIFCSLVWGLYTYRLENIPFFVPPGHVLLFWLGLRFAPRMSSAWADRLTLCYLLLAAILAVSGVDQFSLLLMLVYGLLYWFLPRQRPLLALMFLAATALELYGTVLGAWRWAPVTPVLDLVTTNPPLGAGAFYCMLDAVVMLTLAVRGRMSRPTVSATLDGKPHPSSA
jgi:hypothetical protein